MIRASGRQMKSWVVHAACQDGRPAARLAIRARVRASLAAWSALHEEAIELQCAPGEAPCALLRDGERVQRVGLSISHDGDWSMAALRPGGAVGIDLMQVKDAPDLEQVARDYLGPDVAAALAGVARAQRALAFAQAWSAHEARLKCLGLGLVEWEPDLARQLVRCTVRALDAPAGYVASMAAYAGSWPALCRPEAISPAWRGW